ncbi:Rpn family recombination-promoting nuclease/putative transposase [Okeania sp.]|uniref:Rpn family recombination-promoting nuclease/putative transposase n=1 Tax=Okeania sp. TaxID=3100323 RepID=UPI002B4AC58F|nr:Rpn family recombination-promoting nuclease/putative transposase [Okeania sp.]MEB3342687.1 Rpn family recombination-promoting nuclease/putative transposase [Okeania sp.]
MIFINPKTDFAFKKIFGSEKSKDILISFLNGILYDGNPTIKDLEILNPYLVPKVRGLKDTYLDVKAKITGKKTVIIEMQVLNLEGFEKRILYNAAKSYSTQLDSGEDYTLLNPVIALTITDFEMFSGLDKVISRFLLKEKEYLIDYPIYDIELIFVELPKFQKEISELVTLTDKWLYFLKSANDLDSVPEIMEEVPEINKAFVVANQANLTREEIENLEARQIYIYDQKNSIKRAKNQAIEEGKQIGIRETQIEIAKKLLEFLDVEIVSKNTGLSLEEVKHLREQ